MESILKHIRFIEDYNVNTLATVAALLALTAYTLYRTTRSFTSPADEIKDVDRDVMEEIRMLFDEEDYEDTLESLFNFALDTAPKLISQGLISSNTDKLTIYSLYKQASFGNACDQEGLAQDAKYWAWKKQEGKPREQCQEEYVAMVAKHSKEMRQTLKSIEDGIIEHFHYVRQSGDLDKINASTGGALQKMMPVPKKVMTQDEKNFVANMNDREKEMKEVYEGLRKQNIKEAGRDLLDMVKSGKIKAHEQDKLGLNPLLFAIDASLDLDDIKKLINEGGCDIKSTDAEGDTALHYAVNLDNKVLEKWLIETVGEDFKEIKNNKGLTPYDDDDDY